MILVDLEGGGRKRPPPYYTGFIFQLYPVIPIFCRFLWFQKQQICKTEHTVTFFLYLYSWKWSSFLEASHKKVTKSVFPFIFVSWRGCPTERKMSICLSLRDNLIQSIILIRTLLHTNYPQQSWSQDFF